MPTPQLPTERELDILKVLWRRGKATVREVYEELREHRPIVQNTVQAFLRTMEQKELVSHHTVGRSFVYRALTERERTEGHLLQGLLQKVFDGSLHHLVARALSVSPPSDEEVQSLQRLLRQTEGAEDSP